MRGATLSAVSLLLTLGALELGVRVLDPLPPFYVERFLGSPFGGLLRYDPELGWDGVPSSEDTHEFWYGKMQYRHNSSGYRDIEHDPGSKNRPAIVFLGDSFAWGFGIEFDRMFVNLVRRDFPEFETFNISERGYGTDQELIAFGRWSGKPRVVVLMFAPNDLADNESTMRYGKPKPVFEVTDGGLKLRNVPVPRSPKWDTLPRVTFDSSGFLNSPSHLLNDIYYRVFNLVRPERTGSRPVDSAGSVTITAALLAELSARVAQKGAELLVVAIPAKEQIEGAGKFEPYQLQVQKICEKLRVSYLDLAPALKATWLRTYFRMDGHLNARGNAVAAKEVSARLKAMLK